MLLCLALPLTVAAGLASDSNRSLDTTTYIDSPATIVAPVTKSLSADSVINREIFRMVLADRDINYNLSATVKDGLVTLDVTSADGTERQRVINEIWELRGVDQVKNELGVNMPPTVSEIPVAVR
jgi:osmotically-inducible protein OsmY